MKLKKKILEIIYKLIPVNRRIIIFESRPDLSDNTRPVFDEFIARGYNNRYRLVWICSDKYQSEHPEYPNVEYVSAKEKIRSNLLKYSAGTVICCNSVILAVRKKNQKFYYLTHGSPFKNVSSFYRYADRVDYIITDGEYMNEKHISVMQHDKAKCVPLGYPRNDVFFTKPSLDISQYLGKYSRYIIWYPTVRQYVRDGRDLGIKPIAFLDDEKAAEKLNSYAREKDVLIIVKPHFAQVANIKTLELSNIKFIDDKFYKDNNIIPYQFLDSCDALLSDYSSVFYDFMLCDKPIGLIWNDVEEFKRKVGFYDFYEEVSAGCSKIYSFDDLCDFINEIAEERDGMRQKRERVTALINAPHDGKSSQRVTDFIIKESGLHL